MSSDTLTRNASVSYKAYAKKYAESNTSIYSFVGGAGVGSNAKSGEMLL
jgi:hypothetical protein